MSKRDRALLNAAGLSIPDVTGLFKRSRQAIYQGLSHSRDYFSAQDATFILHEAKRQNSVQLEQLIAFIEANYPVRDAELILFDRVGREQLNHVAEEAEEIVAVCNGHFELAVTFTRSLIDLVDKYQPRLRVVVPSDWVTGYFDQVLRLPKQRVIVDKQVADRPSFVMTKREDEYHAFLFLRMAVEEVTPFEAKQLWEQLLSPSISPEETAGMLSGLI